MSKRIRTDNIIIHCSATGEEDISYKDVKGRYHFFIDRDGKVDDVEKIKNKGNHTDRYNDYSIGICLAGGRDSAGQPTNNFTENQLINLSNLLDNLIQIYPNAKIVGHSEIERDKNCPCFNLIDYLPVVEEQRARVSYVQEARNRRRGRQN